MEWMVYSDMLWRSVCSVLIAYNDRTRYIQLVFFCDFLSSADTGRGLALPRILSYLIYMRFGPFSAQPLTCLSFIHTFSSSSSPTRHNSHIIRRSGNSFCLYWTLLPSKGGCCQIRILYPRSPLDTSLLAIRKRRGFFLFGLVPTLQSM